MTTESQYEEEVFSNSDDRDWESEARAQGWKAPEELPEDFAGEPVDAKTFVQRGEQFVSLLKPKLDKLEKKLEYQEQVNKDLKNQYKRFEEAKKREIDNLETQLKAERKQAVADGDGEAFDQAEAKLEELNQYRAQSTQESSSTTQDEELPPWAEEWTSENPWYGKDPDLTVLADNYADRLRASSPNLGEKEFLDKVTEYVKVQMPQKFKTERDTTPSVEGEGGRRGGDGAPSNAKTYNNLPQEAKKECSRLMNEGIIKDKEQFAEIYFNQ